jgi:hypothetical protein
VRAHLQVKYLKSLSQYLFTSNRFKSQLAQVMQIFLFQLKQTKQMALFILALNVLFAHSQPPPLLLYSNAHLAVALLCYKKYKREAQMPPRRYFITCALTHIQHPRPFKSFAIALCKVMYIKVQGVHADAVSPYLQRLMFAPLFIKGPFALYHPAKGELLS